MKKFLPAFLFAFATFYGTAYSQTCAPNPIYANEPPGLWPDSVTNLPLAATMSPYSAVIDFKNVVDTTANGFTIKVYAARIHEVSGLPAGFNYYPSYGTSQDGWVNPGTAPNLSSGAGCMLIEAAQPAVQAAYASPNSNGVYPLLVTVDLKISTYVFGNWSQPAWMSQTPSFASMLPVVDRYRIKIEDGYLGMDELLGRHFELLENFPNPVGQETTFVFYSPVQEKISFKVYDLMGREVFSGPIHAKTGLNYHKFIPSGMGAGVYLCIFSNGQEAFKKQIVVYKS